MILGVMVTFIVNSPIVLTLAGVTGIVLSTGMAVDANILIFERIKEELKNGRNFSAASNIGFERAWSSIRDSNLSSLITCTILWIFGSAVIKGFAVALAMGIVISMLTSCYRYSKLDRHHGFQEDGKEERIFGVRNKVVESRKSKGVLCSYCKLHL